MLWLQNLFFWKAYTFARTSGTRPLQIEDLMPLPDEIKNSQYAPQDFNLNHAKHPRLKFLSVLLSNQKKATAKTIFLFQWHEAMIGLTAIAIHSYLSAVGTDHVSNAIVWGAVFSFSSLVSIVIFGQYMMTFMQAKMTMTHGLQKAVLRKAFHLNFESRQVCPSGDLINRLEVDVDSVTNLVERIADFLGVLTHLVIATVLLNKFLGIAGIISVLILSAVIPIAKRISRKSREFEFEVMNRRDARVTYMSQVITGIRVIKSFVWEKATTKDCLELRNKELESLEKRTLLSAHGSFVFMGSATMAAVVGFGLYIALGNTLTPAKVFAALVIYADLPMPFQILKDVITVFAKTMASAGRLVTFFSLEEVSADEKKLRDIKKTNSGSEQFSLVINDRSILDNISFSLEAKKSLAIVGRVGSGKSMLLESLLGEIQGTGAVWLNELQGTLAYVPQQPFILNASIKKNIEFGIDGSAQSIEEALQLCALLPDLKLMPKGIETEIGEHGINLSGGQKQRISLARAVAMSPEIILMDDPFSALDVKTELLISKQLLFEHWAGKTRICVTHRLSSLPHFDKILFLENGKVSAYGSYRELLLKNKSFKTFLESELSVASESVEETTAPSLVVSDDPEVAETTLSGFTQIEDRRHGHVRGNVYKNFLHSIGEGPAWKS